ncbi:MAG: GIY-YIG nuclease family protein [Solirubrobacterales bacterium]
MYYIYILECSDGSLYTGYTNDLKNRLKMHNSGKGAKYTRGRLPALLVYYETFDTKSEAMKRECEIKSLSRPDKIKLIELMDKKEIQILLQI